MTESNDDITKKTSSPPASKPSASDLPPYQLKPDEEWLTQEQAAEKLHIAPDTMRRYVREGKFPRTKVGKGYRIPEGAIDDFLRSGLINYRAKRGQTPRDAPRRTYRARTAQGNAESEERAGVQGATTGMMCFAQSLKRNPPLDLTQLRQVFPTVVKLGRARIGVIRHVLRRFERAAVAQKYCHPCAPKRVVAEGFRQACLIEGAVSSLDSIQAETCRGRIVESCRPNCSHQLQNCAAAWT